MAVYRVHTTPHHSTLSTGRWPKEHLVIPEHNCRPQRLMTLNLFHDPPIYTPHPMMDHADGNNNALVPIISAAKTKGNQPEPAYPVLEPWGPRI